MQALRSQGALTAARTRDLVLQPGAHEGRPLPWLHVKEICGIARARDGRVSRAF